LVVHAKSLCHRYIENDKHHLSPYSLFRFVLFDMLMWGWP